MTNLSQLLGYLVFGRSKALKPRRRRLRRRGPVRDPRYRAFVRTFPCCACGRPPRSEAAHTGKDGGTSQKSSDLSCVPLCCECHWEYDNGKRSGALFEEDHCISMVETAGDLNRQYFAERRAA